MTANSVISAIIAYIPLNRNQKQMVTTQIPYQLDWEESIDIKKISEDLKELKKLGATYIVIENNEIYVTFSAYCKRLETDDEYKNRLQRDKAWKQEQKSRELKELERLKAKYELK